MMFHAVKSLILLAFWVSLSTIHAADPCGAQCEIQYEQCLFYGDECEQALLLCDEHCSHRLEDADAASTNNHNTNGGKEGGACIDQCESDFNECLRWGGGIDRCNNAKSMCDRHCVRRLEGVDDLCPWKICISSCKYEAMQCIHERMSVNECEMEISFCEKRCGPHPTSPTAQTGPENELKTDNNDRKMEKTEACTGECAHAYVKCLHQGGGVAECNLEKALCDHHCVRRLETDSNEINIDNEIEELESCTGQCAYGYVDCLDWGGSVDECNHEKTLCDHHCLA